MKKVYVANPDNKIEQYRLVINVSEYYSVGVELSLEEVQQLQIELKDLVKHAAENRSYGLKRAEE